MKSNNNKKILFTHIHTKQKNLTSSQTVDYKVTSGIWICKVTSFCTLLTKWTAN